MIYDRGPLTVWEIDGAPTDCRLKEHSAHYYAELEVYHKRFWESVQAGDRVLHKKFGEGTVVSVKQTADGQEVKVAFAGGGIRSLLTKYAVLKKL